MNTLLKQKFDHVRQRIDELRNVLQENREDVMQQHAEKEDLLQEKWRDRKHVTPLNRIAEDYDVLDEQNQAYAGERKEIRERLARVLQFTKALQKTYRP